MSIIGFPVKWLEIQLLQRDAEFLAEDKPPYEH